MKIAIITLGGVISLGSTAIVQSANLFQPTVTLPATNQQVIGIARGDVNGDGYDDIVASVVVAPGATGPSTQLYVYLGQSDGTFNPTPVAYPVKAVGSVAIGDLNTDGPRDIAVDSSSQGIEVLLQNSSGGLGSPVFYPTPYTEFMRVGDLNNDGRADIIGLSLSDDGVTNASTAGILYQNAAGGFDAPVTVNAPHGAGDDMELVDVNNDGLLDVVVMNGYSAQPNVSILYQTPAGTLSAPVTLNIAPGAVAHALGVGDVNGDVLPDIVVTYGGYTSDAHLAIFLQNSDGTFAAPITRDTVDATGPVEIGNVDDDNGNRKDIVILHRDSIGLLLQNKDGTLAPETLLPISPAEVGHYQQAMLIADVNGDGVNDIVYGNVFPGEVRVMYGISQNNSPIAVNDSAKTVCGKAITIDVLKNDSDPDGDSILISSVQTPKNGTATLPKFRNSITYTPRRHFVGVDKFTYTIQDSRGGFSTATVTVIVR